MALSASLAEVEISKKERMQKEQTYAMPSAPSPIERYDNMPTAPLGWSVFRTADNEIFYQNDSTGETTWDRPIVSNNLQPQNEQKNNAMYQGQNVQPQQYASNHVQAQPMQSNVQQYATQNTQQRYVPNQSQNVQQRGFQSVQSIQYQQPSTYNMPPQTNNNLQYNAPQSVEYDNNNGNGMDAALPPNIEDMDGLVNFVNGKSPQMEELHDPNDALWSMLQKTMQ